MSSIISLNLAEAANAIARAVDASQEASQGDGFRDHLGASVIGKKCVREIWYNFRWAYSKRHKARTLRIWDRGHDEEPRLIRRLREIGGIVEEIDPQTGVQFRIKDHFGHFGGSCDGKISNLDRFGLVGTGLLEMKTMAGKYFKALQEKGLALSNLTYYVQMQVYMHYLGLPWGLFVAVNKDDDQIEFIIVPYKKEVAERYVDRARDIIEAGGAPERISNDSSWWACKMCDYREICHHDRAPHKNCRSCVYATTVDDGKWRCLKHNGDIPSNFMRKGCENWEPIR